MLIKVAPKKILLGVMTRDAAITYRANYGIPGDVTRVQFSQLEAQAFNSAAAFPAYGLPCVMTSGKIVPVTSTGQLIYGVLARPFPITGANASDPLGTSVPPTTGVGNVLRQGYISVNVQLGGASCAIGSGVYIRFQSPSGSQIVGGFEGATSANNYLLTNAFFMGPVDANGNAEISFNLAIAS